MKTTITLIYSAFLFQCFIAKAQWEVQNIDANNISAPIEADGFLFNNLNTNAHFEVPKFSGKNCIYASNLWMGGLDQNGILHLAAQTYKQSGTDYWPAPLTSNGATLPPSTWNKIWHIDRSAIDNHIANYNTQGYQLPQDIIDWPGSSFNGVSQIFAPFVDINNNGIYDPAYGDYPNVLGDEAIYVMYNDKYAAHGESVAIPIEAEVYSTVYAYNSTGSNIIDHTVFVRHRIRNRSQLNTYSNFYVGIWNDFEIGDYVDDFIGTDINRNMVYGYNATDSDAIYGLNPPAIGMKILNQPLHNAMFYNNAGASFYGNNPSSANHYYNYLRSVWKDDTPLNFGLDGYQTGLGNTNFCFSGVTDPNFTQNWVATTPIDYRIIASAGPFTIAPNGYITIDVAYIYARGSSTNGLPELGIAADVVQNFYQSTVNALTENDFSESFKIYPSPADDFIYVTHNINLKSCAVIQVTDITGKLVLEEKSALNTIQKIDVSNLNAGIYFIRTNALNSNIPQKFIKN